MDITTIIVVAVMAVVLIVMLVCKKSMAASPMLQPILFLCVALELGGVIYVIYNNVSGGGSKSIIQGQLAFYHSRGYIAGEYLAKVAPGKKMLLIANPGWDTSRMDGKLIEALKKNYGDVEIDTIVVPPNAEEQGIMISELMTNKALDAIIDKHPDAGVIAFLYGLPENPQRMKIFTKKDHPVIFLFEMGGADGKWLTKKLADGTISGVIISKRGVKHTTPPKRNDKDTFDVRYILVNKDNVDANRERIE